MIVYHALDCLCDRCTFARCTMAGAAFRLEDGKVKATWPAGFPNALKDSAKGHREAFARLLEEEAAFERMTACPKRAAMLAICSRSSRPEARKFADMILNRADLHKDDLPKFLQAGYEAALAIQGRNGEIEKAELWNAVKEILS